MSLRVALFTETFLPKVDGIVTVMCLLLDHLAERGVHARVFAPHLPGTRETDNRYGSAEVIRPFSIPFPVYPELRLGIPTPWIYRELRAFQPDVVHLVSPSWLGVGGLLMARAQGIPTLASFHLDLARMARHHRLPFMAPPINLYTRVIFNLADDRLAPSRLVQEELTRIGVRDVGLWGRGVDAERFNPRHYSDSMRYALSDGDPDAPLLLYVGRLSQEKQIHHLRPVLDAVPSARLAIVGDGPERDHLERLFVGTRTRFMGYLVGEALSQAYASADVFVFPSALETFGLVVTEAMAAGLAVVASRVGGVMDVVREGETGYTFAPGDVPALIAAVQALCADRDALRRMGRKARRFAETQSWDAMMDAVIDRYRALRAGKRAGAAVRPSP